MSFESETKTITLQGERDVLADVGSFFLKVLRELGSASGAPEQLAADWAVVATWLGCDGRELTQEDRQKFGLAFRSYLAQGVAPSNTLNKPFKRFAAIAKVERWPIVPVPQELIAVFKRMMASDRHLHEKRAQDLLRFAADWKSVSARLARPARPVRTSALASSVVYLNWIPLVVSIAMLLMATADRWPYGFYQLLRIVVTGTAAYIVVQTVNRRTFWPWSMGGIAILFNPILPISFTREEWQPIDFGMAVIFLIALIQTLRRRL